MIFLVLSVKVVFFPENMGQSIQEKTKWNLWKKSFKKFEGIWSA